MPLSTHTIPDVVFVASRSSSSSTFTVHLTDIDLDDCIRLIASTLLICSSNHHVPAPALLARVEDSIATMHVHAPASLQQVN